MGDIKRNINKRQAGIQVVSGPLPDRNMFTEAKLQTNKSMIQTTVTRADEIKYKSGHKNVCQW